jgi:hypothetical protein
LASPQLGLCSNLFTDATVFLQDLAGPLSKLIANVRFQHYDKGHIRNASFPLPADRIAEIAGACDGVILAYGHCGSCTGGTMRDAVSLALSKTPVVALVTEKFIDEARFLARAGGVPDLPLVVLPHPVAGREAAYHAAVAQAIAPAVRAALYDATSSLVPPVVEVKRTDAAA